MRPSEVLPKHREVIRALVLQSGMSNPRLFGSVLHGDDTDESDLDILVDEASRTSLFDLARLQLAIEEVTGVKVDVRIPGELHPRFRDRVLTEAMPL